MLESKRGNTFLCSRDLTRDTTAPPNSGNETQRVPLIFLYQLQGYYLSIFFLIVFVHYYSLNTIIRIQLLSIPIDADYYEHHLCAL